MEDKEVQKGLAKVGDIKCKICHLQYENETRKTKVVQACKTTRKLPKNWFDTKFLPKQVKDIKKRLKNFLANEKFNKRKK